MAQRSLDLEGRRRLGVLQLAIIEFEVDLRFVRWSRRPPRSLLLFPVATVSSPAASRRRRTGSLAPPRSSARSRRPREPTNPRGCASVAVHCWHVAPFATLDPAAYGVFAHAGALRLLETV
jgi:hypothetical protein